MTFDDDRSAAGGRPPGGPRGPDDGIRGWLARSRRYSALRFLLEATGIALLLRIPVVWLGAPFVGTDARTAYDWLAEYSPLELALIAILVGPVVETVVGQWVPIAIARRLVSRDAFAVALSAWLFGWLHFTQGALLVLIMFSTGLVLAWTFVVWRERGLWQALAMTTGVHALLNAVALAAALLAAPAQTGT
ncbi:MAG TPA: CPBP family glutamic-type intramembrane protease [Longimicrobiales bacterium]|nr:CPBP family glutamic-type intramembrane protease [Longimicrobiales bacterium]